MAKTKASLLDLGGDFAFFDQLGWFYKQNRKKIRSRYNDLTKKYLAYNDPEGKSKGEWHLRPPQFEALEMYVFIKEFLGNAQIYDIFDDWRNRKGRFEEASFYTQSASVQHLLDDVSMNEHNEVIFNRMKQFRESYPNYIYALTMGLGKTVLMATCIFYEFLLANKYPKDPRYCHNALVFAPDRTVLESLREIKTFDKSLVMPSEYVGRLDSMIKFHYLDDAGIELSTIDNSEFNIVISNNQKIIVTKKHAKDAPGELLFKKDSLLSVAYGDDDDDADLEESDLKENKRFQKLLRLPQLGVYVDEAHHLFGSGLIKELRAGESSKTSLRETINRIAEKSGSIVACYNFTGTPYVENQVLPEVVYSYGLKESIANNYLKDVELQGHDNVKSKEFLRGAVKTFWERYGETRYEGLLPKLAIFAATVEEAMSEIKPELENILSDMDIPLDKILINVGDPKYTKEGDIKLFNDLDKPESIKQFIVLVGKGREGWNCRSLFGVALFRSPRSKIFVLQATMRCLRSLTDEQQRASVFLSKENYDTLDAELHKNFNMDIKDMKRPDDPSKKKVYRVKVVPPPRKVTIKRLSHKYTLVDKGYSEPLSFGLDAIDTEKYEAKIYVKDSLRADRTAKIESIDEDVLDTRKFSEFTLVGEVARYLNISPLLVSKIIRESADGADRIVEMVNRYNDILHDVLIPNIFHALYEITSEQKSEDFEATLLHDPKDGSGYYEFTGKDGLVVMKSDKGLKPEEVAKSFHADTYCFDSKPEHELFLQYITDPDVAEIFFTGMFTSGQGDLSVQYYDPNDRRVRRYFPDFLAKMKDGSYRLIEVKGAHMIDDELVLAKKAAAEEMSQASNMSYEMYIDTEIMHGNVLHAERMKIGQTHIL